MHNSRDRKDEKQCGGRDLHGLNRRDYCEMAVAVSAIMFITLLSLVLFLGATA